MLFVWLLKICLSLVAVQAASKDFHDAILCRACEGFQTCGRKDSTMPPCIKGSPCTESQYSFCIKMSNVNDHEGCDRVGRFSNPDSPHKFYLCKFNKDNTELERRSVSCPSDKIFDSLTLRCLTRDERKTLDQNRWKIEIGSKEKKFDCEDSGTFQDPDNCKIYHKCNEDLEPEDFSCPSGMYFDGESCTAGITEKCAKQLKEQFKRDIDLGKRIYKQIKQYRKKNRNKKKGHNRTGNERETHLKQSEDEFDDDDDNDTTEDYYDIDGKDNTTETTPATTEGRTTATAQETTTATASTTITRRTTTAVKPFECPYRGRFRDPDDCHSFYNCERRRGAPAFIPESYLLTHRTCPQHKWFAPILRVCVRKKPFQCL